MKGRTRPPDVVDAMTKRLLEDAGLTAGMRVLDVGCGWGTVTCMAAQLVGHEGSVVGLDREPGLMRTATEHARELGLANVSFVEGDLMSVAEHGTFDVVVGRRVLMYQPDAVAAVSALALATRPGGLIVSQEHDFTMVPGRITPLPLHERVQSWLRTTVEREGADLGMGLRLWSALNEAGLDVEHLRAEAVVQTPSQPYDMARIVGAIMPRIVEQDVATEAEIDIDTLGTRLAAERRSTNATFVSDMVFGAWARKPK